MNKINSNFIFVFLLSSLLWYLYVRFNILHFPNEYLNLFNQYNENSFIGPIKYRILIPEIVFWLKKLNINILHSFIIVLYFIFIFSITQLFIFYKLIFSNNKSKIALIISSIFIITTYLDHILQPWSYLDIGLYSLTYSLLFKKYKYSQFLFFLICILAILNRETGIFIPVLIIIDSIIKKAGIRRLIFGFSLIIINILILFLLRKIKGYDSSEDIDRILVQWNWNTNIPNLIFYLTLFFVIGGPFLFPTKVQYINFKSIFILFLLFLPFYFVYGNWIEIRVLLPFTPLYSIILIDKLKFD